MVLRALKKALGHETALTKQHVDELSINESETYGLNFPHSPQGLQNEGEREFVRTCLSLPGSRMESEAVARPRKPCPPPIPPPRGKA